MRFNWALYNLYMIQTYSITHYWGEQAYSDEMTAVSNALVGLFTFGGGYHNFVCEKIPNLFKI